MTKSAVVWTDLQEPGAAGRSLGEKILAGLEGQTPDAVIVFVSPRYDAETFLQALQESSGSRVLVGCSSAGEFTEENHGVGQASAVALVSDEMQFACGLGLGLKADRRAAAKAVVGAFAGAGVQDARRRSALVLTDALAGHADELVEELTMLTGGSYQFFGGGAGDDANFRQTQVFCGTQAATDAVVVLEILSEKPLGVGVRHGWAPVGPPMRVTESDGGRLISLNATVAAEVFAAHARDTGQTFNLSDPVPFFLHNIIGIDTGEGYKLRVPLAVHEDGSVGCAAEIPLGATVRIMTTTPTSAGEAAASATRAALERLNGNAPGVALFFDCVATRLRLGNAFASELRAVKRALGTAQFAGCNTYGQVARAEGQFGGFHNCTAVVCVLPA